MSNPAEIKTAANAGLGLRITGVFIAVIFTLSIVGQSVIDAEPNAVAWIGALTGFALIVIGYLQKISAK